MTFLEERITREAEHAGRVARQNALDAGKTREQAAIDEHLTVADVYALLVRRLEKDGK